MEAQHVTEKILADAKAEAEKIKSKANEKEEAERTRLDEQLAEYRKQTEVLATQIKKGKKEHLLAAARMKIAKEFLAEKGRILDEVFDKARQQLQNWPDKDYRELMAKLMLDAVETGDEEVIIDKDEKRIDEQFINQINQQLSSASKGNLKLSDERGDIGAGFILRQSKIKNNVSISVLLAQVRKELEIKLAKELFED
ncbi:MAG: V-type ATP synthase subunit E [Planctomycetota bacterium]|jgi:V/A-type H+-transporting ATPase subunit E